MHPIINELAEENPDVLFVKVDMEDPKSIDLAMKYKVSALPTLVFIRDGELLGATVGLYPKENIQNLIYDFLL
jgi:thioredoxin-like negative regulator of GroEL